MPLSVDQVVRKWVERTSSSAARAAYEAGINAVTENPMAKAAEADDKYLRKVEESVRSGKRRASLLNVPMERWKQNAITKGSPRLASGAQAAESKARDFMSTFLPYVYEGAARVRSMPNLTEEDAKARMLAQFEHNRRFRRGR